MLSKIKTAADLAAERNINRLKDEIKRECRRGYIRGEKKIVKLRYPESYPDPKKVIYVDPSKIDSYLLTSPKTDFNYKNVHEDEVAHLYDSEKAGFKQKKNIGRIFGGNWDQKTRSWDHHLIYQSFIDVYRRGKDWEDTGWVQAALKRIDAGYSSYGYTSKEEFLNNRIPYLEQLYISLNENGYLRQNEVEDDHRTGGFFHEIGINIGRNGELIYNNRSGQNRLSFAKLLGLDRIPVIVIVRHAEWQKKRSKIAVGDFAVDLNQERQQIKNHPDVADLIE